MSSSSISKSTGSFTKRVLCVDLDCFSTIGGGQTAYLNLARKYPDYCFYYPSRSGSTSPGFANIVPVPYEIVADISDFGKLSQLHPKWHLYDLVDYVRAVNMARTFRGINFDVVDIPDYNSFGRFLRFAFEQEGVRADRFIQSLHGRVSDTYLHEWFKIGSKPNAYDNARQRAEDLALASLDGRYGLSEAYINSLRSVFPYNFTLIDPLLCVSIPNIASLPNLSQDAPVRPVFIGRLERLKGADLFVQMLWDLGSTVARRGLIIGSEINLGGISARARLFEYLHTRGIEAECRDAMSHEELLHEVFYKASVIVLPSRLDSFNLIALEAVLHGCPVLLGRAAGASSWLGLKFPGISLRIYRENCWENGSDDLRDLLDGYHEYRLRTIEALQTNPPLPDLSGLVTAYEVDPDFSRDARNICRREFDAIERFASLCIHGGGAASAFMPSPAPAEMSSAPQFIRKIDEPQQLRSFLTAVLHAHNAPEDTPQSLDQKRSSLRTLLKGSPYLLRTHLLQELAEIEDKIGDPLVAAAYRIRVLRWLDGDRLDSLHAICRELSNAGLAEEAHVMKLLAAATSDDASNTSIFQYLTQRFSRLRTVEISDAWNMEFSRHKHEGYRASIIVSNYNTPAERFSRFLNLLKRITMVHRGEAEVIVIDSGSPSRQWELNGTDIKNCDIDISFVRTTNRESIQQAWNRGIRLARGEYLSFLGTDEAIRPDALDLLSACLDNHAHIDWAMGDSFISAVDVHGALVADKLAYLRSGMNHTSLFFDCTYLSYVGGLYRKSIHDRYGYYDSSFRGAGDTEFKCRIFPELSFHHVSETLGHFLDYPSERTTNSAWVEIEDARAWYIFRTLGGIRYSYQDASQQKLEAAFWGALTNRRSFTSKPESDVSLAYVILRHIKERFPKSETLFLMQAVRELLDALEAIGFQANWSYEAEREFIRRLRASERHFRLFQTIRPDISFPQDLTTDARFFAHTWLWE